MDADWSDERFVIAVHGCQRELGPREIVSLSPGESLTIPSSTIHQFRAEEGTGWALEGQRYSLSSEISSPSDIESAVALGCRLLKFFPAEASGGISYLKSMGAPYAHLGLDYIPLGGLDESNFTRYLALDNVPAVGGLWIAPRDLIQNKAWATDHPTYPAHRHEFWEIFMVTCGSEKTDWEVELAVVIGRVTRAVSEARDAVSRGGCPAPICPLGEKTAPTATETAWFRRR